MVQTNRISIRACISFILGTTTVDYVLRFDDGLGLSILILLLLLLVLHLFLSTGSSTGAESASRLYTLLGMSKRPASPSALSTDLKIQRLVEDASSDAASFVDESNLAKHVDWLERAVLLNLDHRTRHANDPEKYPSV